MSARPLMPRSTGGFVAAIIGAVLSLMAYAQPTADQIARDLGEMEWHASVCHLPTAPLEAALERYIKRVQAGPLEADHLRQEMLAGRAEYERMLGRHMNCNGAASEVADIIAKTDRSRPH
jgi:hypothetical protein